MDNKMNKELLAPAGDIEAGYAAIHYGADAVYLGLQQFSARATATNFDEQALNEFIAYAHAKGRKVFVALNTLLQECELPDLLKALNVCVNCQVDALIVQDLGVARVVREQYPEIELHASTQMAVHNKEGALALQKAGFSRVVLARELTLTEIKEIASIPGLETEAFIHGALCYSYSGLCLFSSMESGRSANRGKCLYPCRSCFKGEEGDKHYFSMKDMALEADVLKMPVTSLKIEGRKKSALYVAAVTDYYRQILDGNGADDSRAERIKQIFSRPWCHFHFHGKDKSVVDKNFVGHRGLEIAKIDKIQGCTLSFKTNRLISKHDGIQIDVPGHDKPFGFSLKNLRVGGKTVFEARAGSMVDIILPPQAPQLQKGWTVYLASSSQVKGAYDYQHPKAGEYKRRYPLDVSVTVLANKIIAETLGKKAVVEGHFEPAVDYEKVEPAIEKAFSKTGETVWTLQNIHILNQDQLFVPVSILNDLRRQLLDMICPDEKYGYLPNISACTHYAEPKWIIKTDHPEVLSHIDLSTVDEVMVAVSPATDWKALRRLPKNKVRLALPAVCRKNKMATFVSLINDLLAQGYRKWEIANYWGLNVLPEKGIDLSFDSSIYTMNTQAVAMAKEFGAGRITLSLEDGLSNMHTLVKTSPLPTVMVLYQDVPLFTSAVCLRSNDCQNCSQGEKWLTLKKGTTTYQALSKDCHIMLFSEKPLCLAAEREDIKPDYYRVDFCYKPYSAEQVAEIFEKIRSFQDVENGMKANVYRNKNF